MNLASARAFIQSMYRKVPEATPEKKEFGRNWHCPYSSERTGLPLVRNANQLTKHQTTITRDSVEKTTIIGSGVKSRNREYS